MSEIPISKFDDAPVSGRGASFMEIFEKQFAAEQQEQSQAQQDIKLPLSEKIKNKNWKIRKSALEEISSKVKDLSSFDPDLFIILSEILKDSHQGNLEEAVNILNSYLEKNFPVPKENQKELNIIIKLLIEKCYSSSKQALKEKSKDMIISFTEYLNNTDILVENLSTLMQSKNQKLSQGAVEMTTILLSLYGSNAFNYKKLSSAMTTLSDKCSPLIKQNIVEFFIELYKWIKKLLKPLIEKKVKDIIKKDIEKGIQQINEEFGLGYMPQPTKFFGKKTNMLLGQGGKNSNAMDEISDIEMNDETEVDIFTKKFGFDDKFIDKMLEPTCKWNKKCEAFDQLTELINPEKFKRKIKNTNRIKFMDMVKRLLKQPNQNVKHSIIKCMGNLSIGLRNNFTSEAKELFPLLIVNFSFNKLSIINDLTNTLINFSNIIDDNWVNEAIIKFGSKSNLCNISKNNLCTFIEKLLDSKKSNNSLNCYLTTIRDIVIKYMDDHSQEIRNSSAKLMAYIKSTKLNLYNNNLIKQALNEQKIKKIEEFDKTGKKNLKNSSSSGEGLNIMNTNLNDKNNNKNLHKKQTNISSTNINKFGNPRSRNENASKLSSCVSADNFLLTPLEDINLSDKDDVIKFVKENFGEKNVNLFDSKKWQEKKEGFTNLNSYIMNQNNEENLNTNYDYYLKFILIKNKSFKENNLIILKESILCINTMINLLPPSFSKKYYNPLLKLFIERISDKKIHQDGTILIENLIEKISPKEVILALIKYIRNKTVTILNGGATIINNIIDPNKEDSNNKVKDNLHLYPIKEIVEFSCFLENNTNSQCRNSGTNILCSLYAYMGNSIKVLIKDLKESSLKAIEEKFAKITVISTNNNSSNNNTNNNILEKVFPRVDISKKITPIMIKNLNEGKWQKKKETIEEIEKIIKGANNKIQPKGLNELFSCIKFNLKEGNKNIVKMIMKLIEELCEALGNQGFRQYQKQIIPGIISNFADKNTQVKEEAINCIHTLISKMGFDSIGCYLPNHLNSDNYEIKNEILNILINNINFVSNKKDYIKEYSIPLTNCLLDKNIIIRSMAEKIVQEIIKYFGISYFNEALKNLKTPTTVNQVKSILNKILKNGNNENAINNILGNSDDNKGSNRDHIRGKSEEKNALNINVSNFSSNNKDNNIFNYPNKFNNNPSVINQSSPINDMFQNNNLNPKNLYMIEYYNNNSPETELSYILNQLYSSNINGKFQALDNLRKFVNNNENIIDQKRLEEIFVAFNTLLSTITKNLKSQIEVEYGINNIIENNQDIQLLRNLLDIYYIISNNHNLLSKLNNEMAVYECYERLFLMISEKSLLSYQYGTNLIKTLNSTIMNFFSNCDVTISIISLIKIVLYYKSSTDENAQVCSIAIKGLDKFRICIFKLYPILNLNKIFESFYHFFSEFEKTNDNLVPHNKNEENALSMINAMIWEFIKIYGDNIWEVYRNSLSNDIKRVDIHLRRSIEINLREFRNNTLLMQNNLAIDYNFNLPNKNIIHPSNNNYGNNTAKIKENNINIQNNENNNNEDNLMFYVHKLKENGQRMTLEEKNNYYKKIVSLLKDNHQPVTLISTKLDLEYYSKIYELYHSNTSVDSLKNKNNNVINIISNNTKMKILLKNGPKSKSNVNNMKINNSTLTEQAKRIQDYKNKYISLTENTSSKPSNIFPNNKEDNTNFAFNEKINDENKQINNNNDLSSLEKRKKELDEKSKGNVINSKSIFNSQSDIPQINTSFITSNLMDNRINSNCEPNNDNDYYSQKNNDDVNYMKNLLAHLKEKLNLANKEISE